MSASIILDGSNILFWRGGHAQSNAPQVIVGALRARRFAPHVIFDNSIKRYLGQVEIGQLLQLAQVTIAPRGTPADALLLQASQQGRIQIVSNDRFRAWRKDHPQLRMNWLVTGSIGKGGRANFSKKLRPAPL